MTPAETSDAESLRENLRWLNEQIAVLSRMHQSFELSPTERIAVYAGRSALRTLAIHAETDLRLAGELDAITPDIISPERIEEMVRYATGGPPPRKAPQ